MVSINVPVKHYGSYVYADIGRGYTPVVSFGGNLYKLRTTAHLSQRHIGAILGIDQSQISKWEKGGGNPSLAQLFTLSLTFGCSLDELVSGENSAYDEMRHEAAAPIDVRLAGHTKRALKQLAVALDLIAQQRKLNADADALLASSESDASHVRQKRADQQS